MKQQEIELLFYLLQQENPNPETELNYSSPYTLLIATVLAAQSTDKKVNEITKQLFTVASTAEEMCKLTKKQLINYIKTIGLYNNKATNIMALSKILQDKYNGCVPDDKKALETLPGVGNKTASVLLNIAFKQPIIAVDTHVFRVCNKTGLVQSKTPEQTAKILNKIVPHKFKLNAHHWLVLHGRYICTARKAKCALCKINSLCLYYKSNFK